MSQDKPVLSREQIENIRRNGTHAIAYADRADTVIALCDLALAALDRQGSGKWVPLEPTKKMVNAAETALIDEKMKVVSRDPLIGDAMPAIYRAMLATAPQQQGTAASGSPDEEPK